MSTLVLGAGSSIGIDKSIFKSGVGLVREIISIVSEDHEFVNRLNLDYQIPLESIKLFRKELIYYHKLCNETEIPCSIDEFRFVLKTYPEYETYKNDFDWISKTAIMYCILSWEKLFKLKVEENVDYYKTLWIQKIIPYFIENRPFRNSTLNIVTFNYDRLIEYFLHLNGFRDNGDQNFFYKRIIHVYGSVNIDQLPFGFTSNNFNDFKQYMGDFITIHDGNFFNRTMKKNRNEWSRMDFAKTYIATSIENYFLGFGFDEFNCDYLGLGNVTKSLVSNIYTGNLSDNLLYLRLMESKRIKRVNRNFEFRYGNCDDFIDYMISLDK